MSSQHTGNVEPSIDLEEHRSVGGVNAKAVAPYGLGAGALSPLPTPLIDLAYDYVAMSNSDANGNYQTWTFKTGGAAGTTVRTLTIAYDANSKMTSITRS